ncbi:hypothetical protein UCDDS831_g07421 [Diplodia seriata]|uniref:Uncharacterized protein n=1 Tax=Diplodia seriata TaxID=420778 RepID=A0A0G2DZ25_9PEZI|nr:hypothetical protein UCDDS831_g07421 [Diplodia seriata]
MASTALRDVDTVIVGNGPSALILSYILHGHIPYYARPHHDPLLRAKLESRPNLLDLTPDLYAHFQSSLRYSTQALPVNTLLDTLIRPNADTEIDPESCVDWRYEPDQAVSHVALGNTPDAGGQWTDNPVAANSDIGTLSYAEMLSLPGVYEGLANATIMDVTSIDDFAIIKIRLESGDIIERAVGGIDYVVGRRGSLEYLEEPLRSEVNGPATSQSEEDDEPLPGLISGRTLREKVEEDLEIAPSVFVIGSLTGDSLDTESQ